MTSILTESASLAIAANHLARVHGAPPEDRRLVFGIAGAWIAASRRQGRAANVLIALAPRHGSKSTFHRLCRNLS